MIEKTSVFVIISSILFSFFEKHISFIDAQNFNFLIILFFTFEFLYKIYKAGWSGYFSTFNNKYDFTVLISCIAITAIAGDSGNNFAYFRLFRVISLFKIVHLIPNSGHIVTGLLRALKSARAIFVLIIILQIFFALLGNMLFQDTLPQYFGTPLISLNSIFAIITMDGWTTIPEAAKAIDDNLLFYLANSFVISVVIIGGFFALSLANAIFVDEMVYDNNDDMRDELRAELNQLQAENAEIKKLLLELKHDRQREIKEYTQAS